MNISEYARQAEQKAENDAYEYCAAIQEIREKATLEPSYEFYPLNRELYDGNLFYVQFHSWGKDRETTWQLFKRNYIHTKEDYIQLCNISGIEPFSPMSEYHVGGSVEGHGYNLGEGILLDEKYPNVVSLHSKKFLTFMVDALNEKVKNNNKET